MQSEFITSFDYYMKAMTTALHAVDRDFRNLKLVLTHPREDKQADIKEAEQLVSLVLGDINLAMLVLETTRGRLNIAEMKIEGTKKLRPNQD